MCAATAREFSGDRDVVPDDLVPGGRGSRDGRGSFYPPCAPPHKVSASATRDFSAVSARINALVPESNDGFARIRDAF